jgi:hypothetical protein
MLIPFFPVHSAAVRSLQVESAPPADEATQHRISSPPIVVLVVALTDVVVVLPPGPVVVVVPGTVVLLLGGQGLGEQPPGPTLIPCSSEH